MAIRGKFVSESIKIMELAKKMIKLSGFEYRESKQEEGDISIEIVGLRPGEKLYEELLIGSNVSATQHPRIMKAEEKFVKLDILMAKLESLKINIRKNNSSEVKKVLTDTIPEYADALGIK